MKSQEKKSVDKIESPSLTDFNHLENPLGEPLYKLRWDGEQPSSAYFTVYQLLQTIIRSNKIFLDYQNSLEFITIYWHKSYEFIHS